MLSLDERRLRKARGEVDVSREARLAQDELRIVPVWVRDPKALCAEWFKTLEQELNALCDPAWPHGGWQPRPEAWTHGGAQLHELRWRVVPYSPRYHLQREPFDVAVRVPLGTLPSKWVGAEELAREAYRVDLNWEPTE